jgi:hypothetical protein
MSYEGEFLAFAVKAQRKTPQAPSSCHNSHFFALY